MWHLPSGSGCQFPKAVVSLVASRPFQRRHALRSLRTRMQTATSETESKSRSLSICVHHYTLRAPCPKGQGNRLQENMGRESSIPVRTGHFLFILSCLS